MSGQQTRQSVLWRSAARRLSNVPSGKIEACLKAAKRKDLGVRPSPRDESADALDDARPELVLLVCRLDVACKSSNLGREPAEKHARGDRIKDEPSWSAVGLAMKYVAAHCSVALAQPSQSTSAVHGLQS